MLTEQFSIPSESAGNVIGMVPNDDDVIYAFIMMLISYHQPPSFFSATTAPQHHRHDNTRQEWIYHYRHQGAERLRHQRQGRVGPLWTPYGPSYVREGQVRRAARPTCRHGNHPNITQNINLVSP
jgi:hypothetical protein